MAAASAWRKRLASIMAWHQHISINMAKKRNGNGLAAAASAARHGGISGGISSIGISSIKQAA